MLSHLIDYMRWYNAEAPHSGLMAQAADAANWRTCIPRRTTLAASSNSPTGARHCRVRSGRSRRSEVDYCGGSAALARKARMASRKSSPARLARVTKEGASRARLHELRPRYASLRRGNSRLAGHDRKVHSCNFNSAYAGFEIMMGLCRSAATGGQVALAAHRRAG